MTINNDTATVSVEINAQASKRLEELQQEAKKFKDALAEARRAGDKVAM